MDKTSEIKDRTVIELIDESLDTFALNNEGYIGIPIKDFIKKKLDETDIRLALRRLRDKEIIDEYHYCFGFYEKIKEKNKPKESKFKFIETGKEAQFQDDPSQAEYEFCAYCIKINEPTFKATFINRKDKKIILFLDKDANLYREPKNKYCYSLFEQKKPLKIIIFLTEKQGKDYILTPDIAFATETTNSQYVRAEIGKMNKAVSSRLKLKFKLIESKQNSGYRLNPKVKINIDKKVLSKILPR